MRNLNPATQGAISRLAHFDDAGTGPATSVDSRVMSCKHAEGRTRLLVVDDCHEHLHALSTALGELGYEVRVAHNGELALSQMDEFQPHGVLLDLNMPVMNGFELAQSLRTYLRQQTVLIGMSGAAPTDPATKGISALVDGWFPKPIDLGALERGLADLLRLDKACAG